MGKGVSLLPAGVREVHGEFAPGDAVAVAGPDGGVFAKGLVRHSAKALSRVGGPADLRTTPRGPPGGRPPRRPGDPALGPRTFLTGSPRRCGPAARLAGQVPSISAREDPRSVAPLGFHCVHGAVGGGHQRFRGSPLGDVGPSDAGADRDDMSRRARTAPTAPARCAERTERDGTSVLGQATMNSSPPKRATTSPARVTRSGGVAPLGPRAGRHRRGRGCR